MHLQFTKENRFELSILLRAGHSLRYSAEQIGFDHSAVIREVNRNKDPDGIYRPAGAHKKMLARRSHTEKS